MYNSEKHKWSKSVNIYILGQEMTDEQEITFNR